MPLREILVIQKLTRRPLQLSVILCGADDDEKSVKFSFFHTVIHPMHSVKISRGLSFFISYI